MSGHKDDLENLNTRKSTSKSILSGILSKNSENSELKANFGSKVFSAWSSLSIISYIDMSKPYDCPERNIHDIRNFTSQVEKYFTRSLCSLVKYYSTLEEKFCISAWPCDILYILTSNTKISTQIKMVTSSLAMISATVEFTIARMSPKN